MGLLFPLMASPIKVLQCFRTIDIDRTALSTTLQRLQPSAWSDHKIDMLMTACDVNGDGKISYEEFLTWICGSDNVCHDFRTAIGMEFWEAFPSLNEGFHSQCDEHGYLH